MRPGAPTLPAALAFGVVDDALDRLDRHELGRGRGRGGGLSLFQRGLGSVAPLRLGRFPAREAESATSRIVRKIVYVMLVIVALPIIWQFRGSL